MDPAEEHDLAVEVVRFDVAGASPQPLPRGPAGPGLPRDLAAVEQIRSSGLVFLRRGDFTLNSGQHRFTLGQEHVPQWSLPLLGTAYGLDGVAAVGEQLAVFQRAMSGRGKELNVAARKSAATVSLTWLIPAGYTPMSRRPVTGTDQA